MCVLDFVEQSTIEQQNWLASPLGLFNDIPLLGLYDATLFCHKNTLMSTSAFTSSLPGSRFTAIAITIIT